MNKRALALLLATLVAVASGHMLQYSALSDVYDQTDSIHEVKVTSVSKPERRYSGAEAYEISFTFELVEPLKGAPINSTNGIFTLPALESVSNEGETIRKSLRLIASGDEESITNGANYLIYFNQPRHVPRVDSIAKKPELMKLLKRPAAWARPMELEGAPNLHKITDQLYRSAQPSAEGMKNLKAMGMETIINLRSFNSDRDEIGGTGLAYERIYMKAWHPERKEVVRFLQIVTNEKRTPVLFHCKHGSDRTGTMCALYRIAVQGWTKEEAIREMTEGGYGFHKIWANLPKWIHELDIESIRAEVGIPAPKKETATEGAE